MGLIGRPRTYHVDRPATNAEYQQRFARKRAEEVRRLRQQLTRKVYHQSQRHDWGTPWPVFREYDAEFRFTLDVCATVDNAKCPRFFTPEDDGLAQPWQQEICWMNPPYGRTLGLWMRKAYESAQWGATVVSLVPARTEMSWWHAYAQRGEIRYIAGRLKFVGAPYNAPFPSCVVIFRPPSKDAMS